MAIACIAAPALAKPAYVASTVNLRAAPGTGSEIVAKIPGGSLVDATACDEGWCEISWQDKKGFAIQTGLDMSGRVPQQRAAATAGPGQGPSGPGGPPGQGPGQGAGQAYRQGVQGRQGPQWAQGPQGPEMVEGPEVVDGPVYYDGPPRAVYYGGPYYRPYYWGGWGWRRRW
jgi:uncharacterized protein YraI